VQPLRFAVAEYGPATPIVAEIAAATGRSIPEVRRLVDERGARLAATLHLSDSPLVASGNSIIAEGIAGLVRLDRGIELEVAPKFLGIGSDEASWAEDFFFLAMLSRHGYLLARESIASSRGTSDLLTLLGNALVNMYWQLHRRPLKAYRNLLERSFFLDGEVDPFNLKAPGADGFEQKVFQFTKANETNAVFKLAATTLAGQVRSHQLQERLRRLATHLGPQPEPPRWGIGTWRLPPRARAWQPVFDLSVDIISGVGSGLRPGQRRGPGFVVNTWRVWQDLLTIAARAHFGRTYTLAERSKFLGRRADEGTGNFRDLLVYPDLRIEHQKVPNFIVDAKYKGRSGRRGFRIAESDIYESLAFSRASDECPVVLAYPRTSDRPILEVGALTVLERVSVGETCIIAVDVEVRGISAKGGLPQFCAAFGRGLLDVFDDGTRDIRFRASR
jgi:5-methylcytosine-specific restriction endonuclease McrBC regulatory subunit McrC